MSDATYTLGAFFKAIEYARATNLSVSVIEGNLYTLLRTHCVIDAETADQAADSLIMDSYDDEALVIDWELHRIGWSYD